MTVFFWAFFSLGSRPQSGIAASKSTDSVIARRKLDIAILPGERASHFPESVKWLGMLVFEAS